MLLGPNKDLRLYEAVLKEERKTGALLEQMLKSK